MKLTVYRLLAVAAIVAGCAGTAAADSKCSAVNIEVTNNFHDPATGAKVDIRVVDFAYWDDEDNKWREDYNYDIAGGGFSTDYTKTSTAFKCVDGKTVAITVD